MKLGNPIEVAAGVFQIRAIGSRVTALADGGHVALVDAGSRGIVGPITSGLDALGISADRIGLIALTHYHPDHSGGLSKLVMATSAGVATHRLEAATVAGEEPPPSPFRNGLLAAVTAPLIDRLFGPSVNVDHMLEDGDSLPGRQDITVVHTPGHTAGSICLYIASKKLVIVGDALQHRLRRLGQPASWVTQDRSLALESIAKLLSLDIESICFSHFTPLRRNALESLRRLMERHGAS